ncbi:unnamed protein product [Prorocentrum cordatum]|uniref:RRM domain-containing protein n=1 Tax=Prorocentrum cordatum TaxID=2364126 RepID=A0ABN9U9L9_9DINO|nr:unnamed protein product [Polarella glacialis]
MCTFAHGEQELGMPQPEGGGGGSPAGGGGWGAAGGKGEAMQALGYAPAAWGKGGKQGTPGSAQGLLTAVRKAGVLGGGKVPVECQIYVKNLPPDMTDLDLFRLFAPFGAIAPSGVKVMLNEDGSCKGFGFVDYATEEHAQLAATIARAA